MRHITSVIAMFATRYPTETSERGTGDASMSERVLFSRSLTMIVCAENDTVMHATDITPASIHASTKLPTSLSSTGKP